MVLLIFYIGWTKILPVDGSGSQHPARWITGLAGIRATHEEMDL